MSNFKFEINPSESVSTVKISGHLDENFVHTDYKLPVSRKIVFDLENLQGINSCGIRDFINLLRDVPITTDIEYEKCPPFFIQQVNIVNGFLSPQRKVTSLFAPYVGVDDEDEVNHFIDTRGLDISSIQKNISIEGKDYEFDGIIEKYFRFLNIK